MLIPVPPSDCMRAREAVSARLDGELSELEGTRLDLHLRRCAACRAYAGQVVVIVAELRRTPLRPIEAPAFEPLRRRRAPALRVQAAAAAVLVTATIGGSFVLGHVLGRGGGVAPSATRPLVTAADAESVRADALEQHLLALLPPAHAPGPLRLGPNIVAL